MVAHGRVELLAHPLSQKYLQMKWNSYGKYFHLANLLFYCIFLFLVTMFSHQLMCCMQTQNLNSTTSTEPTDLNSTETGQTVEGKSIVPTVIRSPRNSYNISIPIPPPIIEEQIDVSMLMIFSGAAILIYVIGNGLKEVLQVYQQKWHYLFEPINFLSWILYVATVIMVLPMFNGVVQGMHYSAASICIFFSWFNLLLLLQRFDQVKLSYDLLFYFKLSQLNLQVGIYVVMFLEILQTLIKVLAVFSILILAFGLAFFILLSKMTRDTTQLLAPSANYTPLVPFNPNHWSFATVPMSLLRTFSMMLGEMDFVGTYVQPFYLGDLPFPFPAFCILCKSLSNLLVINLRLETFSMPFRSFYDFDANPADEFTYWSGCR